MSVFRRTSSWLFAAGFVIAITAAALMYYHRHLQREFSKPTVTVIGTVVRGGRAPWRTGPSTGSPWFCWVGYQFSSDGGAPRKGWALWWEWEYACDVKRDGPIPIQYVVGHPERNRPAGAVPPGSPTLLWFAAGVMMVIGVLRRGSAADHRDEEVPTSLLG